MSVADRHRDMSRNATRPGHSIWRPPLSQAPTTTFDEVLERKKRSELDFIARVLARVTRLAGGNEVLDPVRTAASKWDDMVEGQIFSGAAVHTDSSQQRCGSREVIAGPMVRRHALTPTLKVDIPSHPILALPLDSLPNYRFSVGLVPATVHFGPVRSVPNPPAPGRHSRLHWVVAVPPVVPATPVAVAAIRPSARRKRATTERTGTERPPGVLAHRPDSTPVLSVRAHVRGGSLSERAEGTYEPTWSRAPSKRPGKWTGMGSVRKSGCRALALPRSRGRVCAPRSR